MKIKRDRRGFTLIEMLIVIGIIGILAVGLGRLIIGGPQKARDASRKQALSQLTQAIEAYNVDKGFYPKLNAANTAECLDSAASGKAAGVIKDYFPGGTLPKDPSASITYTDSAAPSFGQATGCDGYMYVTGASGSGINYMIVAAVEDTNNGNMAYGATGYTKFKAGTKPDAAATGEYYVVLQ